MQRGKLLATILVATCYVATWLVAAESRSVLDGVYSKEQAARGKSVYNQECARCHAENLGGGEDSPELAGDTFREHWKGKTVGTLFEVTRKTMPTDGPGTLSRKQYADVIAYVLSVNEVPAGQTELGTDLESLNLIRIESKR